MDLFEGALRIARAEYPALDVKACEKAVDTLARDALRRGVKGRGRATLEAYHKLFVDEWGFRGNREDYYDPRNSYINDVLRRRVGIPISLATVYELVGSRLGLKIHGVAFPGHFLARWSFGSSWVWVDCFNGRLLDRKECLDLLRNVAPSARPTSLEEFLAITPNPRILSRMLGNLRQIHARLGDYERVIRWISLDLEFNPEDVELYRDRGLAWTKLEAPGRALDDLERYLTLAPASPDAELVRRRAAELRMLLAGMN
jgi:regulator of sirC expression with transglutaminase-like and TPR domain